MFLSGNKLLSITFAENFTPLVINSSPNLCFTPWLVLPVNKRGQFLDHLVAQFREALTVAVLQRIQFFLRLAANIFVALRTREKFGFDYYTFQWMRLAATCSRCRSTSPACGSPAAAAWSSAAARSGSRRSRACSSAAATVTLVAPAAHAELERLAREGSIDWERREYRAERPRGLVPGDRRDRRQRGQHRRARGRRGARDARQRRRRAAAVQLHPARDRPQRAARDRDLDRRRLAGARQADEARDRRAVRRGLRAAGGDAQRRARLGEGDAADLPGPQGVLRGDRRRRARPDRAAARRRRAGRARADRARQAAHAPA